MDNENCKVAIKILCASVAELVLLGGDEATVHELEKLTERVRAGEYSATIFRGEGNA